MSQRVRRTDAEVLDRPYGTMLRLAVAGHGLRNHQLLLMTLRPQQETSRHRHPQEEIYFVLTGHATFKTDAAEIEAAPFDTVIFLENEAHQVVNVSSTTDCEILLAISPLYNPKDVVYLDR